MDILFGKGERRSQTLYTFNRFFNDIKASLWAVLGPMPGSFRSSSINLDKGFGYFAIKTSPEVNLEYSARQ